MTGAGLRADLVLEGGGVKGIALVGAICVLEEHGYSFNRVAGTSAGSIVGALVAAGLSAPDLHAIMAELDYRKFRDESLVDHFGLPGKALSLLFEEGIYEGNHLKTWLGGVLADHHVRTFADLKLVDPESTLPPERNHRLVVMSSDISRGRLVRLPWDYPRYDLSCDDVPVVDAVRASMSIPFFYEPVKVHDATANATSWLVDGGMLSNFPIDVFDRDDGQAPRWPTFGIKLSARPSALQADTEHDVHDVISLTKALVGTMTGFYDHLHLDDPAVIERTIFIDTLGVRATDFDIDRATQQKLYDNGRAAAEQFLATWDWTAYVEKHRKGAVPAQATPVDLTQSAEQAPSAT